MIHRVADDEEASCYMGDCENLVRYSTDNGPSCASHINLPEGGDDSFDLVEAIGFVALESQDFDVNIEGEIKLKEEDA